MSEQVPPETPAAGSAGAPGARGHWLGAIVVLILLQLPWPDWLFPGEGLSALGLRELVFWLMAGLLLAYVLFYERRPPWSIGFVRLNWKSLAWGVGGAAVMVAGMALIYLVILPALGLLAKEEQMLEVKALPLWFRIGVVTRAAVFEELFYRGFAIERLADLTGRRWFAALISLGMFTFAHLGYWGWTHLIIAGFGGLVLTALYLMRRDLASNMIAHWLTDGVGFFLG